jgi:hypothetical protein
MRRAFFGAALAAAASPLAGCASSSSAGGASGAAIGGEGTIFVTFRVEDAMVSPTKADGTPWDEATPLDEPKARDRIVSAMDHSANAKAAYDAAKSAIRNFGEAGGRPDVGGRASVDNGDAQQSTRTLDGDKDTFTPHFGTEWTHVALTHWTTVHMYFVDHDPGGDDDIAAVVLSPLDLAEALKTPGKVHHVRVDDQTNGQVLFVGISVTPEK